jgi:hypothetical protein
MPGGSADDGDIKYQPKREHGSVAGARKSIIGTCAAA